MGSAQSSTHRPAPTLMHTQVSPTKPITPMAADPLVLHRTSQPPPPPPQHGTGGCPTRMPAYSTTGRQAAQRAQAHPNRRACAAKPLTNHALGGPLNAQTASTNNQLPEHTQGVEVAEEARGADQRANAHPRHHQHPNRHKRPPS
ncbi:hypothetical protein ECG_09944 [Echinococcus granulosus]|nr:hypothetical protein ECG_09944 [Echinococcus granulosus]